MIIAEQDSLLRIDSEAIPFATLRGKPNRIRLVFSEDNELRIETGNGKLGKFEKDFLESKRKWILKSYRGRMQDHAQRKSFLDNIERSVLLFGSQTEVEYNNSAKTYFRFDRPGPFRVFAPEKYFATHKKEVLYYAMRKFAELYLAERVDHWAEACQLSYNVLRIKDLKSKWGSCSTRRNLNLNWQLVFLDESVIDYVIVHELMHLREMNHSPAFWNWVGKYYPDYKRARKQLKEQQWLVGILK